MLKYLLIINLLIMTVLTQDMPPPDLDISTWRPLTTTEQTTLQPTSPEPTTTEEITTTTKAETITITESATTTTEAPTVTTDAPTTEAADTTPEPTTSTAVSTTPTTIRNDVPFSPATDSPFSTTTTTTLAPRYPFYPSQPDYFGMRCYFKQQYGYPKWRWTCQGFKYVYPIECFQCCHLQHSRFAGCVTVHAHHCNSLNNRHGYYK